MQTRNNTDKSITEMHLKSLALPKLLGLFTLILSAGLMLSTGSVRAEQKAASIMLATNGADVENTKRNVRDRNNKNLTPEHQKGTRADVKITRAIRKAIIKDDSLSVDAHNAKIITRNGTVTLRGPVQTVDEKTKLQSIAEKIRGVKQIDNQLEPKTP